MSTRTLTPLPHRTAQPGALDRTVLASAVGFALDSLRRGVIDPRDREEVPGFTDEGLVWQQSEWVGAGGDSPIARYAGTDGWLHREDELLSPVLREQLGDFEPECGTGCCIAGWIELHSPHAPRVHDASTAGRAAMMLVGFWVGDMDRHLPGLPEGLDPDDVTYALDSGGTGSLFAGSNDLNGVLRAADTLLGLYGMEPLVVEADGTVR